MNSNFIIFILVLIILYLYLNNSYRSSGKIVYKGSICRNDIINKIDPKQFNPAIHHPACL